MWLHIFVPAIVCSTVINGVIPANVTASALFQPVLQRMWQSSPTFRRQCRRLAAAPRLHVSLVLEELSRQPSSYHARSVLTRKTGVLVAADIQLTILGDPVELIAHEIEHVLEQLDGVDLQGHARSGTVLKRNDGAFETRRAIAVGKRVAEEVTRTAHGAAPAEVEQDSARHPVYTIALRDPFAGLADAASGRISASGRHVVFASYAALVPEDGNRTRDIYVLDIATRHVTLETMGPGGRTADGESVHPAISRDGRLVVFESTAGNLTNPACPRGIPRVFLKDRQTGLIRLLSTNTRGEPANGPSMDPVISADGEAVAFTSSATDITTERDAATAGVGVYLIRLASNERSRVDVTSAGQARAGQSASPAISADGRYVAFMSRADLTVHGSSRGGDGSDGNGVSDIYLRDTLLQHTRRLSQGRADDTDGPSYQPAISSDGRFVAFASEASNLIEGGGNRAAQIYLRDVETGAIELISHTPAGRAGDGGSARPIMSGDGSVIAYQSLASNLLCDAACAADERDINLLSDVYVYYRPERRTRRASSDAREEWMEASRGASLDETGQLLAFTSLHSRSPCDTAHDEDLFLVDLSPRRTGSLAEILDEHQIGNRCVPLDQDRRSIR